MPKPPRRRRRRLLLPLLAAAVLAGGFLYWDNTSLQTARFDPAFTDLPAGFDGCRLVVLSDLHGAEFGAGNADLFAAVAAEEPDYIFYLGDLQDKYRGPAPGYPETVADGLTAIAPTYYVTGNHEWAVGKVRTLKDLLTQCGVQVLSNEYVTLERDGATLALAGVDDPNGYAGQKTAQELHQEIEREVGPVCTLLLAHRNDRFDQYAAAGYDLVLSGHGHGGIVRLPFTDGLLGTNRKFFPTWTSGVYTLGESTLFVSRGLGNNTVPISGFRLFNRPELAVLELTEHNP